MGTSAQGVHLTVVLCAETATKITWRLVMMEDELGEMVAAIFVKLKKGGHAQVFPAPAKASAEIQSALGFNNVIMG